MCPDAVGNWRPDDRFVPTDRRWAGLDRDTIGPAAVVLALAALMALVLPAVERTLAFDDPTREGDVIRLRGATFDVPAGWGLVEGKRAGTSNTPVYPPDAELEQDAVNVHAEYSAYAGTAHELLEDVRRTNLALATEVNVLGDPVAMKTSAGLPGLVAKYAGASTDGIIAAFVFDGRGVTVVVTGPPDALGMEVAQDVGRMLLTLTPIDEMSP